MEKPGAPGGLSTYSPPVIHTYVSWLAPGQRGRGIGEEVRAAVLHLAFAGLGAREAESDAFTTTTRPTRCPERWATSRTAPRGTRAAARPRWSSAGG
jgi:hypothetical protein